MSTLAAELRREAYRLRFQARQIALRGKTLTLAEAHKICEQLEKELRELEDEDAVPRRDS